MGYSIAFRCKNKKWKELMFSFMKSNYRDSKELFNIESSSEFTGKLVYRCAKNALSFYYGVCPAPEFPYIYAVVRWMALKVGSKKEFKKYGKVPFYIYEGFEMSPIYKKEICENNFGVNELGYRSVASSLNDKQKEAQKRSLLDFCGMTTEEVDKKIYNELKRLEGLWVEYLVMIKGD